MGKSNSRNERLHPRDDGNIYRSAISTEDDLRGSVNPKSLAHVGRCKDKASVPNSTKDQVFGEIETEPKVVTNSPKSPSSPTSVAYARMSKDTSLVIPTSPKSATCTTSRTTPVNIAPRARVFAPSPDRTAENRPANLRRRVWLRRFCVAILRSPEAAKQRVERQAAEDCPAVRLR